MIRFLKILTVFLLLLRINLSGQLTAESSVLSKGKWFRIAVTEDGIYRIDYSVLSQLGLENPSFPVIYGNNAGQLSYYVNEPKPDDLKELAIYISGDDNILGEGEYILFFARGTGRWIYSNDKKDYSYLSHNYSDTAYYFITSSAAPGKTVLPAAEPLQPANFFSAESDALFIHEKDESNLIKSGRDWFQRISEITINPEFKDLIASKGIKYNMRVAARSSVPTIFRLTEGSTLRKSVGVDPVNLSDINGTYAEITDSAGTTDVESSSPVYRVNSGPNPLS